MVILGLGSNLGDCLGNLRYALQLIRKIPRVTVVQVSPIYISDALLPDQADASWDKPFLNLAIRCETTLSPYDLLTHTKNIEKTVGRTPEASWGPRIIDIDLLAWDDVIQYDDLLHIPHEHLLDRPFALWPLADIAPDWRFPIPGAFHGQKAAELVAEWGSRFDGFAPFHTRQIGQRIDTPSLVGIINLTPDSFSSTGQFSHYTDAVNYAKQLVLDGAEIIDIGAEATGPNAKPISSDQEWQRLELILQAILATAPQMLIKPKISIDTYHPEVAQKALRLGVDWINDISGLENPAMCDLAKNNLCDLVFMHHLGIPVDKNIVLPHDINPATAVFEWARQRIERLEKQGIDRSRLIFDPGIGYGKTAEQSFSLLKQIALFQALNTRLLIGHSRKSFLQLFTNKPASERDIETLALSLELIKQPIDYLRIHHVESHARAFKVAAINLSVGATGGRPL